MMTQSRVRGFTLLEVLVALVVAVLSLGAVLAAVSQMADTGLTLRERTYASWIGQNKITELRLANVLPEVSESNGEIEYADQEWAWSAKISETGIENLFRVDVDISRPGSNDVIRSVIGFIGEPSVLGESNRAWSVSAQVSGATN